MNCAKWTNQYPQNNQTKIFHISSSSSESIKEQTTWLVLNTLLSSPQPWGIWILWWWGLHENIDRIERDTLLHPCTYSIGVIYLFLTVCRSRWNLFGSRRMPVFVHLRCSAQVLLHLFTIWGCREVAYSVFCIVMILYAVLEPITLTVIWSEFHKVIKNCWKQLFHLGKTFCP